MIGTRDGESNTESDPIESQTSFCLRTNTHQEAGRTVHVNLKESKIRNVMLCRFFVTNVMMSASPKNVKSYQCGSMIVPSSKHIVALKTYLKQLMNGRNPLWLALTNSKLFWASIRTCTTDRSLKNSSKDSLTNFGKMSIFHISSWLSISLAFMAHNVFHNEILG